MKEAFQYEYLKSYDKSSDDDDLLEKDTRFANMYKDVSLVKTIYPPETETTLSQLNDKLSTVSNLERSINDFRDALKVINTEIKALNASIQLLTTDNESLRETLLTLVNQIQDLNDQITTTYGNAFKTSDNIKILDLESVSLFLKNVKNNISTLKTSINEILLNYSIGGENNITNVEIIINELNYIKDLYLVMKKTLRKSHDVLGTCDNLDINTLPNYVQEYIQSNNVCDGIKLNDRNVLLPSYTESNYTYGQKICENKKGTCIYEEDVDNGPNSYFTGSYDFKFYKERWPNEDSCEAQTSNCFSIGGELSDKACDEDNIDLYFIKSKETAKYYHKTYGYRSEQLPSDGDGVDRWNCLIDFDGIDPVVTNRYDIEEEASNNCENHKDYGRQKYQCFEIEPKPFYGSKEPTNAIENSYSKTWVMSDTSNCTLSEPCGECTIQTDCRTEDDVTKQYNCLKQTSSNDYGHNWECYKTSDINSIDGTVTTFKQLDQNNGVTYRKRFIEGLFDNTENVWKSAQNHCVIDNETCRTKHDVDAEYECLSNQNWKCNSISEQPSVV